MLTSFVSQHKSLSTNSLSQIPSIYFKFSNIRSSFCCLLFFSTSPSHIISSENITCATRFDRYISSTQLQYLFKPDITISMMLISFTFNPSYALNSSFHSVINSPLPRTCLLVLPYIF